MKIVGIAGLPRSGKDSLAELYIKSDYFGVSLGDIVRNEARVRHKQSKNPISVLNMTETANYLRAKYGADFALKKALNLFKKTNEEYKGLVIYSVRAPIEADFIIEAGGELVWVEASDKIRYQRSKIARRAGEPEDTLEEMLKAEALQETPQPGLPEEAQMNTSYVKKKATIILENNGSNMASFLELASNKLSI